MSLISKFCNFLSSKLEKRIIYRKDGSRYLERYYILHNKYSKYIPGIYLHKFISSDEDPELHDHPWSNSVSLILSGGYTEEQRIGTTREVEYKKFKPGMFNLVRENDFHRIELDKSPTWTLFFSGDVNKSWGFWDQKTGEYIPWQEHVSQ